MKKGIAIANLVIVLISISIIILGAIFLKDLSKVTSALPSPREYFLTGSVYPEKAQQGTMFNVKFIVENVNRSDIYRINARITKDNSLIAEIPLFDDGLHGDEKENDGIFANIFDSSQYASGEGVYYVDASVNPVENKDVYSKIASFQIFNNNCISLKYNGNPSDKIDVVLVPSNYKSLEKFTNDAIKYIDFAGRNKGILALEPFKSNIDKFNFYIINQSNDLGCELNCQGISSMICCNDNKVSEVASQCPTDQIIVLNDDSNFCGTASYYAKVCTIARGPEVLTHEWGHAFGGLGDQYDYGSTYPNYNPSEYNYPNCDNAGCLKWGNLGLTGVGCFKVCGVETAYKPTDCNGEMCTYVGHYDPVEILYMRKILDNYSPLKPSAPLPAPPIEKSYIVNLNSNNSKLSLNNIYATTTTAPDRKFVRKTDYQARIISFSGQILYSFDFEMPKTEYPFWDYNLPNASRPSPIVYSEVNRTITVPYFANARIMHVYGLDGRKVLDIDLTQLSSRCGDGICEENENALQCLQDCSEQKKDGLCNYEKDNICDPDCMNVDPDCKQLSSLMILDIAAIAVFASVLAVLLVRKKH